MENDICVIIYTNEKEDKISFKSKKDIGFCIQFVEKTCDSVFNNCDTYCKVKISDDDRDLIISAIKSRYGEKFKPCEVPQTECIICTSGIIYNVSYLFCSNWDLFLNISSCTKVVVSKNEDDYFVGADSLFLALNGKLKFDLVNEKFNQKVRKNFDKKTQA